MAEFSIHPAGTFNDAKIIDHGFDETEKGVPFLWTVFETSEGQIIGRFFITEKSIEYTLKKIKVMGFDGDDISELKDGTVLAGNLVQLVVSHEEYEGRIRAKVDWVNENNSVVGPRRSPSAAFTAGGFKALWKKIKTAQSDDIPF